MFKLNDITNENNEDHNRNFPYTPDHPYKMLIIGGSGSRKTNALFNWIKEQDNDELIDKIYLYARDLNEPKYQFLIKKREKAGMYLNDPETSIECSNTMDDVYNNIHNYNLNRNKKNQLYLKT